MSKNKSLVEDTFLQMRNLEEVINENAKGILASTMKEEIRSLVKESLNEQDDEEEIDLDAELDDTDVSDDEVDNIGDEDEDDDQLDVMAMGTEFDDEDEDDTIDLTGASAEDVLKVFKAMGPEDGVIVKREDDMIHLSDDNNDVDYFIQLSESEQEDDEKEMLKNDELDESYMEEEDDDVTETIYEIEMDEEDGDEDEYHSHLGGEMEERYHMDRRNHNDPEDEEDLDFETNWDELEEGEEDDEEFVVESKSNFKSKGVGMGNASKFKYDKKPNQGQGFKTKMKQGTRGVGMGKAKFEYKEGENMEKGKNTTVKKMETKEASRTLGNGSNFRKGGLPKPRAHSKANTAIKKESVDNRELQVLREKNEEYRSALNVFRDKLNEVAVFNSNLAYATRLFTEHSTTKQEKINILKRFDSVETLKESKNLYKSIKDELSDVGTKDNTITESFERTVEKTPTSGSAVNLIESKTYENPQFLRMKDLMSKLK
jgi:hypothetical protein